MNLNNWKSVSAELQKAEPKPIGASGKPEEGETVHGVTEVLFLRPAGVLTAEADAAPDIAHQVSGTAQAAPV